jgi:hypothetical protein
MDAGRSLTFPVMAEKNPAFFANLGRDRFRFGIGQARS